MPSERVLRVLIEAMAKHLPPSGQALRLLDVDGATAAVLMAQRPDIAAEAIARTDLARAPAGRFDAVTALGALSAEELAAARTALRPGGRVIVIDPDGEPGEAHVHALEAAGYIRILVEIGAECPLPLGVLLRGEQPHTTDDTLARVQHGTDAEHAPLATDFAAYRGRYVFVLARQMPNKPVWALADDEPLRWEAFLLHTGEHEHLLTFSSLPNAVSFMQRAVLAGALPGVNKIAKFPRETAAAWALPILLNPDDRVIQRARLPGTVRLHPIDSHAAIADE
jgi:SAM-dependent methyltransferase